MPDERAKPKVYLIMMSLTCRCGGTARGLVREDRTSVAFELFKAHHMGSRCEPSYGLSEPESTPWMVGRQHRLDPAAVCRSAWWR